MKAIVFDNAGTIIRRVTALKDMNTKKIIFETNTIDIVNKNDESLILVFQTPTKKLINHDEKIIDYLLDHKDSFEIAYSTNDYSKEQILDSLKNDGTTFSDIKDSAKALVERYNIEICSGSALIVDLNENRIDYAYTAGGIFFEDTIKLFESLKNLDYSLYIASGDNKHSLLRISNILGIPSSNVFDTCNVNCKEEIVKKLQKKYEEVLMVGNNTNDCLALKQADIGILSVQQGEKLPEYLKESSDYIIDSLNQVLKIVKGEV